MLDLKLSYSEYSTLIQALLNRIDFLSSMVDRLSRDSTNELYSLYKDDLDSVHSLYVKLKNM